jgi:hypothetical protein
MGTKVYNKLPGYIKEIDSYKAFKKELKSFLQLASHLVKIMLLKWIIKESHNSKHH